MSSYSYKPASGLEGASTIVPLKKGGFLEVRRGEKTTWEPTESRRTWATLEEWKAGLPTDAVVSKKAITTTKISKSKWSADFIMTCALTGHSRRSRHTPVILENNLKKAETLRKHSTQMKTYAKRYDSVTSRDPTFQRYLLDRAAAYEREAQEILAAPAFNRKTSLSYNPMSILNAIYAQRIADGVFIPIFFDKRRAIMHTPILESDGTMTCKEGTTFAKLGINPVFKIPCKWEKGYVTGYNTVTLSHSAVVPMSSSMQTVCVTGCGSAAAE